MTADATFAVCLLTVAALTAAWYVGSLAGRVLVSAFRWLTR